MILFGAGSSVPFEIPGMRGFTKQFIARNKDISEFIMNIEDAISKGEEMIGISLSFDLETLLSVLNDLSSITNGKAISAPTASLLLKDSLNIKTAREKYGNMASSVIGKLREFIFETCMQPIKRGRQEGNFGFLDRFYGPLLTVLNFTDLRNIQEPIRKIFSTNWDLCFKTWADYVSLPIHDGTSIDKQSFPILNVEEFTVSHGGGFDYVPLHGSLDLIKIPRPKGKGIYHDVFKLPDPVRYFEDKPQNMKNVFMIYPLEAVGYEESIKSPYLDMLNAFRTSLRQESTIFIIGYSLRDPTIGSIFEEVIAERIRNGDLNLLSEDFGSRISAVSVSKPRLKIVVINPDPHKLAENLTKQAHTNLLQTFIPIETEFPEITDGKFTEKYTQTLSKLMADLKQIGYMDVSHIDVVTKSLEMKYDINLPEIA